MLLSKMTRFAIMTHMKYVSPINLDVCFFLGRFPFVRTGRPDHGRTSQIENEIGFFKEFLLKMFSFLSII